MAKIEFKDLKEGVDVFVDGRHFGFFTNRAAALNELYYLETHSEGSEDWTLGTR